jgi:hypothetical protein
VLWFHVISHLMAAGPNEYKIYTCLDIDPQHPFPVIVEWKADSDVFKEKIHDEKKQTLSKDVVENFEIWKVCPEAPHKFCH